MQNLSLAGQQILVLGMGVSGRSAAEFLLTCGALVCGVDQDVHLLDTHFDIQRLKKKGLRILPQCNISALSQFDFLVLSPGIPSSHSLVQLATQAQIPIVGEIELGCRFVKDPILGITGTNGKTTVTLLVAHILNHCGQPAKALGNVGSPLTHELLNLAPFIEELHSTIILELSSYQIETLYHPSLDAAIILNITPDHLDRYKTMEAYARAKCAIERALKRDGQLYIEEEAWRQFGSQIKHHSPRLYGYEKTSFIHTDLKGVFRDQERVFELPAHLQNKRTHEIENILAAYALCADRGVTGQLFLEAFKTFEKPPHRIEFVSEVKGVRYYDDSKGTNFDAVVRAVEVLEGPIILIAGGVDKGFSYTPWLEKFNGKVKLICAIGQAADKIEEQLGAQLPVILLNSLEEAVHQAARFAQKGEAVLLSPGCSSFDMFKDYIHRGNEFQRIVGQLTER